MLRFLHPVPLAEEGVFEGQRRQGLKHSADLVENVFKAQMAGGQLKMQP